MLVRSEWSALRATELADLKSSAGIPSIPGDFLKLVYLIAFETSSIVGGEVKAGDHGLLWDLVKRSGVQSGGSVEQSTEVFPPTCIDAALLLKQGWAVSWQERHDAWLGRVLDFLDGVEEHFWFFVAA